MIGAPVVSRRTLAMMVAVAGQWAWMISGSKSVISAIALPETGFPVR